MHLIFGSHADYHSAAVAWALQQSGEDAMIWDGIGIGAHGRIAVVPGASPELCLAGQPITRLRSVWFRRPTPQKSAPSVAAEVILFVDREMLCAHRGIGATARQISDLAIGGELAEPADIKLHQLNVAARVGFLVPPTLITNDDVLARRFVRRHGRVAIKPFEVFTWWDHGNESCRVASTSLVDPATYTAVSDALEVCPCILQKYIEKKCELRVTVIGEHIFAASIVQAGGGGFTDWRYAVGREDFQVSSWCPGPELRTRILEFMGAIGLVFGCLDLIVDPHDQIWFLEVNPAGQFLFVEEWLPDLPLLSTFTEMMRAGSAIFQKPLRPDVSLANLMATRDPP